MRIENKLEQMKKVYHETSVSDEQVIQEWKMLEDILGEQQKTTVVPLFLRTFAFAAVILLLSGGVVTIAQASKPGELLYPVKEVSQKVMEDVKQSISVFHSVTPTPSPSLSENNEKQIDTEKVNDEDQLKRNGQADTVKGASDAEKGNNSEEKNTNSSWNNAGGKSEEEKGQNSENGNNHSGSDNSNNNNQSENGKKENPSSPEKVDKNSSENHGSASSPQGQGKSDKNTSKN